MTLNHPKERPVEVFERPSIRGRTGLLCVILIAGCLLDLPELKENAGIGGFGGSGFPPPAGAGGDSSTGGSVAGTAGTLGGSGSSVGGSGPNCGTGEKACNGTCRVADVSNGCGDPSCTPCPQLANATMGCSASGQCVLISCNEGFADCNADSNIGADLSQSNGCEYSFGTVADPTPPLLAPLQTILVDGTMDDWVQASIPAYPLREVCTESGCGQDDYAPITAFATLPPVKDLDAYFRIAWDRTYLYLVVEAADDNILASSGVLESGCKTAADCEDSIQFFFDGFDVREPNKGYDGSGRPIFLGLGDNVSSVNGDANGTNIALKGQSNGPACYRIEARILWRFLVPEGNAPEGQFPAEIGNTYGFDISVNDWDTDALSQPPLVQRQSHVFWVDPGEEYRRFIQGFQTLQLIDAPSAEQ